MLKGYQKELNDGAVSKNNGVFEHQFNIITIDLIQLIGKIQDNFNLQENADNHFSEDVEENKVKVLFEGRRYDQFYFLEQDSD